VESAHAMAFDEGDHVIFEDCQVFWRWRHGRILLTIHCKLFGREGASGSDGSTCESYAVERRSCQFESARTTEVSIWRSGTVQYFLSSRFFSCGPTI
jgi:hypothetical protein